MRILVKQFVFAALVAVPVLAHIEMISPCPRFSAHGKNCPALPFGQEVDYSLIIPLGESQPLCKYTTPYSTPSATWTAGQSVTISFQPGGAAHNGGHCQFSMSYDGGKTFVVVHEELKYCFVGSASSGNGMLISSYTIKLPSNLPASDKAVFAWTWANASGNREFYMNCADVAIKSSSTSFTGKEMTIVNHSGYETIPEFGGSYDTGLDIYNKAKQITVTSSGVSKGASNSNNDPESSSYVSSDVNTSKSTSAIVNAESSLGSITISADGVIKNAAIKAGNNIVGTATATAIAITSKYFCNEKTTSASKFILEKELIPTNAATTCSLGEFRCGSDTASFDTCDNSGWISRPCAPGTVCQISADSNTPCQLA